MIALRRPRSLFALSSLLLLAACVLVARSGAFVANPDVAAWGITFDLTISIPLLYWFFVVRGGKARPLTIAPVFIAGTLIAGLLVPRAQQQFLSQLKMIAVPAAELALIAALVWRVRRTGRLLGDSRVENIVASEIAMFHYALFAWRKKPEPVAGHAFTVHERSGWNTILACIFVLIAAEGIGMHLLLGRWSAYAAWGWTALDVWAVIWLLGDYHALRLKRSYVDDEALHIHYGMRWSVTIPLASIASIEDVREEKEWKRRDVLRMSMLEEPRHLIALEEPVVANGLAGLRKTIRGIALLPDDDATIDVLRAQWRTARERSGR